MGIKEWLFGSPAPVPTPHPDSDKPPLFGGDGLAPETAVIVNCASTAMARSLIGQFVSKIHGQHGSDWEHGPEFFVRKPGIPDFTVRAVGIKLSNGEYVTYYFNLARPHGIAMKMAGL